MDLSFQSVGHNLVSAELKETQHLNALYTSDRDTVMWHWSGDTFLWQLSIDQYKI